jgi:hypothetical protein
MKSIIKILPIGVSLSGAAFAQAIVPLTPAKVTKPKAVKPSSVAASPKTTAKPVATALPQTRKPQKLIQFQR